jgi:predicted ATPase/DNA-binding CsgD family transcriptional regulator
MPAARPPDFRVPSLPFVPSIPPAADTGAHFPTQLTTLIAREQELAAIGALLRDPGVRLLTLTGPGGVGKTRLAIAAATDVVDDFPEGVAFVNLAPIAKPTLVLDTIAGALGLRDMGTESLPDRLIDVLAGRRLLLVLDNFEQVVTAGPRMRELLEASPGVTLLITSRIALRLSGEREFPVAPLPLSSSTRVDDAGKSGAVRLFIDRAQAIRPDFMLNAETLPTVAEIVSRVDGLPLAIELAAARLKALPPAALLQRLEQRLPLLSGGARDLPLRQQTMRDTIGWSYDLLTAGEQALFRRLAVFVGGFTLEAAEAMVAALRPPPPERSDSPSALDTLTALIDHSLLLPMTEAGDEPRYQMLETVREFGLERLEARGEAEERAVRADHAAYIQVVAAPVRERQFAPGYALVLSRLDSELDNVRAALTWAVAAGEAEIALRLASTMGAFWIFRGHFREGRHWLERALALTDPEPTALRTAAVVQSGWLATLQGDIDTAEPLLTNGLHTARDLGAQWTEALALLGMGMVELQRGDLARAAAWSEAALSQFRKLEDADVTGRQFLSVSYANRGQIALIQGDTAGAAAFLEEAERRQRALNFSWGLGDTLRILGDLARDQGDREQALAHYRESLELSLDHGDKRLLAETFSGLASVIATRREPAQAAKFLGAAEALRQQIGTSIKGWDRPAYERGVATVRATFSPGAFASAWTAGAAMRLAAVIAEALVDAAPTALSSARAEALDPAIAAGLTPREGEVLRLLSEGVSDREIAATLSISERTAGNHVQHILQKLGVDSRTAAAVFAVRHGLA